MNTSNMKRLRFIFLVAFIIVSISACSDSGQSGGSLTEHSAAQLKEPTLSQKNRTNSIWDSAWVAKDKDIFLLFKDGEMHISAVNSGVKSETVSISAMVVDDERFLLEISGTDQAEFVNLNRDGSFDIGSSFVDMLTALGEGLRYKFGSESVRFVSLPTINESALEGEWYTLQERDGELQSSLMRFSPEGIYVKDVSVNHNDKTYSVYEAKSPRLSLWRNTVIFDSSDEGTFASTIMKVSPDKILVRYPGEKHNYLYDYVRRTDQKLLTVPTSYETN